MRPYYAEDDQGSYYKQNSEKETLSDGQFHAGLNQIAGCLDECR